jgi:hemoglobin
MTTLYEDGGGMDGLLRLSDSFYKRVLADPLLAPVFASFTPTHVDHVAVWLAEVLGGPEEFTARLGGHHALLESHLGLGIRDEHRQRWLELMDQAIGEVLPGQPRLHDALMAYFDWGTAIAEGVSHSPAGIDLGEPGPTPRWGYDGLIT